MISDGAIPAALLVTGPEDKLSVPRWAQTHYRTSVVKAGALRRLGHLGEVTVVRSRSFAALMQQPSFLEVFAGKWQTTPGPARVIFMFDSSPPKRAEEFAQILSRLALRIDHVEFASGSSQAAFAVEEARGKLLAVAEGERPAAALEKGSLGEAVAGISATRALRAASGRLSARPIAEVFGISLSELSDLLVRNRQTVAKTDDAEALQAGLVPFERVARLRAALGVDDFRRWLNRPNRQLGGQPPLAVIRQRRIEVVAVLAENMLDGNPT